ncbi:hypothetical protein C8Q72DRAFT_400494 [Fomitopsis betulina]|nr:hypothetical protein C8Q72DRAFT_400494 [Fomitopsis betulina]
MRSLASSVCWRSSVPVLPTFLWTARTCLIMLLLQSRRAWTQHSSYSAKPPSIALRIVRMPYGCLDIMVAECDQSQGMPAVGYTDTCQATDIAYIMYEFGSSSKHSNSENCTFP